MWIAQQDGATSKPGTDAQYKLVVKSGSVTAERQPAPPPQPENDCSIRAVATALNRPYGEIRKVAEDSWLLNDVGAVTSDLLAVLGAEGNMLGDEAMLKRRGILAANAKCDSRVPAPKTVREFMRAGFAWHGRGAPAYGVVLEVENPDGTLHAIGFYGSKCSDSNADLEVSKNFPVLVAHVLVAN